MSLLSSTQDDAVAAATSALDAGDLIVVPGDATYLLAGDALDDDAVERIFLATARGADRPLTILLSDHQDLHHVAYGGGKAREVADARWPGPTAFVLKARPWLPEAVTAGGETVAVSVPAAPFTRALAKLFGPIAVASLGATDAQRAQVAAGAHARLVVDAGALPGGETAVIDVTTDEAKVIRAGTFGPRR